MVKPKKKIFVLIIIFVKVFISYEIGILKGSQLLASSPFLTPVLVVKSAVPQIFLAL